MWVRVVLSWDQDNYTGFNDETYGKTRTNVLPERAIDEIMLLEKTKDMINDIRKDAMVSLFGNSVLERPIVRIKVKNIYFLVHPDDYQKVHQLIHGKSPGERIADTLEYNIELSVGGREVEEVKNDFNKRARE